MTIRVRTRTTRAPYADGPENPGGDARTELLMRILIAEDDPISRRVLAAMLSKWGYEVSVTSDGNEAWDALRSEEAPRLAILDWMMPGVDGAEIIRRVRQLDRKDYIYAILLTAKDRQEDIIAGMDSGADDYIVKPFDSGELKVRLRAAQRILDLQTKLLAAQEQLQEQATHDALTSLWNRCAIMSLLKDELERSYRERGPMSVIIGDLDGFKTVNDTHGHAAGDSVLREAADRMSSVLRAYDQLGRYGGEEFLVVLPGCPPAEAERLGERIRKAVAEVPTTWEQVSIPLTISLGVASTAYLPGADAETLVRYADAALYRAKEGGRNRVELATANVA